MRAAAGRPDLLIGFSTHNPAQAAAAAAAGADYIGFGPVFGTRSKANPDPTVGLDALAEVCRAVGVPVVAIGGITLDAVPAVARAGAVRGRADRRDRRAHRIRTPPGARSRPRSPCTLMRSMRPAVIAAILAGLAAPGACARPTQDVPGAVGLRLPWPPGPIARFTIGAARRHRLRMVEGRRATSTPTSSFRAVAGRASVT